MIKHTKIAIVGGGPGGLTLARLLQMTGADVTVYERDTNRQTRTQGGALDLHEESGLAALKKAALMDAFNSNFRPGAELMRITDHNAVVKLDEHEGANDRVNTRPEIDRGPLRDILLDSLEAGTVVWNKRVASLERRDERWRIKFDDGNTVTADLVIGADGSNSRIRSCVTSAKPVWAGVTMIEGSIKHPQQTAPTIDRLLAGGKIFAFGNSHTLIVSSKGDGGLGFTTSHNTAEGWVQQSGIDFGDHESILAWFKQEFGDWDPVWQELFQAPNTLFIPRPQYCMPLDLHWDTQPGITLIGDAAHWMPPFAGEGVNMAMLDALELSERLADPAYENIQDAISGYEKGMFARFTEVGADTMFNTRWMHEPGALEQMLAMFA